MEDYSKENLDVLFDYGLEILSNLQNSADEKDKALEDSKRRYDNLREDLKDILNKNQN